MKKIISATLAVILVSALTAFVSPSTGTALTNCTFTVAGTTMYLDDDCTTDSTIFVPDGMTLDGQGHTITALDPVGDHFRGAVVANAGTTANVTDLIIDTDDLANACDAGGDRLRGIMFEGASGFITHNMVMNINQGPSGCQEGNAIEVRNAPFDGTHPDTKTVEVAHNQVTDYQKTGIVANGDVDVDVHHNHVGASATQDNLAANSIQLGFGALGSVTHNQIDGNQWCGPSEFVGTAILLFDTGDGVNVSLNNIRGNSDVGIYAFSNMTNVWNNRVFDDASIADCNSFGYDIGIGDYDVFLSGADDNTVANNKARGFDMPYDEVAGGKNITIPGPQNDTPAF